MNKRRENFNKLYDVLLRQNMSQSLQKMRYGGDTDIILKNNLSIMCPDTKYELSKGTDIKDISEWLKIYVDYGVEYFEEYKSRIEKERIEILNYLDNKKKNELFNSGMIKRLPIELKLKIMGFLPMKERGLNVMEHKWEEMSKDLKYLKILELNRIINKMKILINELPGWSSIDYERVSNLRELINGYTMNMNKESKIGWIKDYILINLNIDSKDEALRKKIIKEGFTTIIKMKLIIDETKKRRLALENDRKEKKKVRRRERTIKT